jgi:hypothetical protein
MPRGYFSSNGYFTNSNSSSNSNSNNKSTNSTRKVKKTVRWNNNSKKVHTINLNYSENNHRNARKSIKRKGVPNDSNLSNEDLRIVKQVLKKNSNMTSEERKRLRKKIVDYLKTHSRKYNKHHLEEFEKNYLKFEAMR